MPCRSIVFFLLIFRKSQVYEIFSEKHLRRAPTMAQLIVTIKR